MYRELLLLALVALVAAPSVTGADIKPSSISGATLAAAAEGSGAGNTAARQPASQAPIAQTGAAEAANAAAKAETAAKAPQTGSAAAVTAPPAAAAANDAAAQQQPAVTPPAAQAAPQPAAGAVKKPETAPSEEPASAVPPKADAEQPKQQQQQQQPSGAPTEMLSSNSKAEQYQEPGVNREGYTKDIKEPGHPDSYSDEDEHEHYSKHDKHMHHTGKAANKMYKAQQGDSYLSDGEQYKEEQYKEGSGKLQQAQDAAAQPTDSAPDADDPTYSTYEVPGYEPKQLHHTGKAAKKMYKAMGGDKYYLGDEPEQEYKGGDGKALSDKDKAKMAKLQKYYAAEAELLAAELEGGDSVSSFARPSKYSNKAAKYAAMALKTQGAKKQTQASTQQAAGSKPSSAQAQAQADAKPSLANLAAAFMKKGAKPADKVTVLSVPKPSLKGAAKEPVQAEAVEELLGEDVSWEEYMANPQLYAGFPSGDKPGVVILPHEQYQKGGKKHGKKSGVQQQHPIIMPFNAGAGYPNPAAAGYPNPAAAGYPNPMYQMADPKYAAAYAKPGSNPDPKAAYPDPKAYYQDPYAYGGYFDPNVRDGGFDMETNHQPPLRRKEARNVYNFRTVGTESISLGYTTGPTAQDGTDSRPVLITYSATLTCGVDGPAAGIGTCAGTGILASPTATQVMMSFTCTIDADASNMCGLKYVQGMTITAQGLVNTQIDPANRNRLSNLQADVLPITGVYVPGRRTTLLADVVTLLSGVKGGSLMLRRNGDAGAFFSFYFWR